MTENNHISDNSKRQKKQTPKVPKKISDTYLHNSGLFYLEKYSASSGHFRTVMLRKVKRSCMHHKDQSYDACAIMVDNLVQKFVQSGLLNDDLYLQSMIRSYKRKGLSKRMIVQKLTQKKLDVDKINYFLDQFEQENNGNSEIKSAVVFCRKKKLGAFATSENDKQKELAKFGRAGFSFDVAKIILNMSKTQLEDILYSEHLTL